jgi:hypothetical protein
VPPLSYVLPFRSDQPAETEFVTYVNRLSRSVEVVLVDGSRQDLFDALARQCDPVVHHVCPRQEFAGLLNGKVRGVLTGLRLASHECVVIADDDVRYELAALNELAAALGTADVILPQNYFKPMPWHAHIDTARSLINRMTGGDWPGTLALRRSFLANGGYDGNVLFENLELVRTIEARGGRTLCLPTLFVRRLPPSTRHFMSQRIRQAYDEFARPERLVFALAVLPLLAGLLHARRSLIAGAVFIGLPILVAELGRRRDGGLRVFPFSTSLCAPLWVFERGLCAWLAVAIRVGIGGMPYSGGVLKTAAHSTHSLARRYGASSLS